ncbi:MAG: hypothetical protein JST05_03720 [Acidobacteria bacterium]|nr:hypothetical protein [Acidobacteriota bacterium]
MKTVRRCLSATLLIYASLMALTSLLGGLPAPLGAGSAAWVKLWQPVVGWVGVHGFHLEPEALASDFGDSDFFYLLSLCFLVAAAVGGTVWGMLDRAEGGQRASALNLALRAWLASALFGYGFVKVFPSQFPWPDAGTLTTRVGDLSPSGLYWAAMGHAPAYASFAGLLETGAGLLLLARRTSLAGALLAAGVLANVVMVNYCYAVGVFFLSLQLLAAALLLVALEAPRIWAFILGGEAPPCRTAPTPRPLRWAASVLLALVLGGSAVGGWRAWRAQAARRSAPLAGAYEPESFAMDGQDRPLLITDGACWKRVWIADLAPVLYTYAMDGTAHGFHMKLDEVAGLMTLEGPSIKGPSTLHFGVPDPGHLTLDGMLGEHRISIRLRKVDLEKLPLRSEPFRWIHD